MSRKEAMLLGLLLLGLALIGIPGGFKQVCMNIGFGLLFYVIGKVW